MGDLRPPLRGFRKVAPALVLFFLSPFVAEFLLGDFSIDALPALIFLAPLYGGGALTLREIARRRNLGWASILILALAYGLLEEGIVIQTLFNPNYLGLHLLRQGWIPALGMGAWWTPFVLTLHTVWSISVPIAVTEGLFPERGSEPWLGRLGAAVAALLLVAGCAITRHFTTTHDAFRASLTQQLCVGAAIVALVLTAMSLCRKPALRAGVVPPPWATGIAALGFGLAAMGANVLVHDWLLAAVQWAIDAVGFIALGLVARRAAWTPLHTLAAAGGAMMAYACAAFGQQPVVGGKGMVALASHVIFGGVAIALLILAARSLRRASAAPLAAS